MQPPGHRWFSTILVDFRRVPRTLTHWQEQSPSLHRKRRSSSSLDVRDREPSAETTAKMPGVLNKCRAGNLWAGLRPKQNLPVQPTCKVATHRGFIHLSPGAARMVRSVALTEVFMENLKFLTWPLPSEIPWQAMDLDSWQPQFAAGSLHGLSSTPWLQRFAKAFVMSKMLPMQACPRHVMVVLKGLLLFLGRLPLFL